MKTLLLCCVAVTGLSGCAGAGMTAAVLGAQSVATNAVVNNEMDKAEEVYSMNCSQLRGEWEQVNSPIAMLSPFQSMRRADVKEAARQRGCRL